ncbi:hypothetical protein GM3708_2218 [Geminocystis sp. NIES-3708]|uniref:phytanoyl-CoA dioxygenase family protein n=1 Tax=Geminocystis sp. NIES-3708 TaxID=1615909 RepID=UPI0005FCDA99|nr:phytanoyl-CoA dioxygenase family protein [Geminocystis sp. NIES-3708]BAQ61812.1 hypothetical protein GM3708_2218 [Geminocystis sp. NIES-3708]
MIFDEEKIILDIKRDGYTIVEFLDYQEIIDIQHFYDSLSHNFNSGFAPTMISNDIHYRQLINSRLKKILAQKMSHFFKSYRLCHWSFLVKQAQRLDSTLGLHYDWSFVDKEKFNSLNIFCPLIDVDNSNGCLKVVKGSHNLNNKPWGVFMDFPYKHLLSIIEDKYLTELPIKAGEAVIFDTRVFHCSPPNQTKTERVVLSGIMIPINSTMRYYHCDTEKNDSKIEVFEVDDEFYTSHIWGVRPEGLTSLGFVDREFEPITIEDFVNKMDKDGHQNGKPLRWAKDFISKLSDYINWDK